MLSEARWVRVGIFTAAVVALFGILGSCASVPQLTLPTPTAAPLSSPTPLPTSTPRPLVATPVATVAPEISQDEAQAIVSAWFNSVLAQDYATASDLTVGNAADQTMKLYNGFHTATGGNPIELSKQRLDLIPGDPQSDGSQAVKADFDVLVNQRVGPFLVSVQRLKGSATFIAGRLEGRTRITDIRDITGLPVSQ